MADLEELKQAIDAGHERVLAAVEGIPETELETAPAVGSWSAREVDGHLADWEGETLDAAAHILGGPEPRFHPIKDGQGYNSLRAALWGTEPWQVALGDFTQARQRADSFIAGLSPEQLAAIGPFPWGEVGRLGKLLMALTSHLDEHAGQLEAWRLRRSGIHEPRRGRW
ncbi:MAG TPA: DinB family protein [Thermomicrobiaceae bacterium]|nr:DinB family protein [Thermomicrobiaceae bacterium]